MFLHLPHFLINEIFDFNSYPKNAPRESATATRITSTKSALRFSRVGDGDPNNIDEVCTARLASQGP